MSSGQRFLPLPFRQRPASTRHLQQIGAPVHKTTWDHAPEQAANAFYRNRLGAVYCHEGDWSWIYFFNGQCTDDSTGEHLWQWLSRQKR